MRTKPFIPARLEVRTPEGPIFIETAVVLHDPDLQARCLEKRELRRIIKIMQDDRTQAKRHTKSSRSRP